MALALVTTSSLAVTAWIQRQEATEQRDLAQSNERTARAETDRADANRRMAEDNAKRARLERDQALITQSRFLSDLARQKVSGGDAVGAALLAVEALPDQDRGRPYVPEAEQALYFALHNLRERGRFQHHRNGVRHAAFSSDGKRVVTSSADGTVRVWDVQTCRELAVFGGGAHQFGTTAYYSSFSPDGNRVVSAMAEATYVWDASTGLPLVVLPGHPGYGYHRRADYSVNGSFILTVGSQSTISLWDPTTGHPLFRLYEETGAVADSHISRDGSRVGAIFESGELRIWSTKDGARRLTLGLGNTVGPKSIRFSHDGSLVLVAAHDGSVRVLNSDTGKTVREFSGLAGPVVLARFNAQSTLVATASPEVNWNPADVLRIWEVATGKLLATLKGHTTHITDVQFAPDGQRILSASRDGTARLWETTSGRLMGTSNNEVVQRDVMVSSI
jgi:WD40 repeat protein